MAVPVLGDADDEGALGGFDDVVGDGVELVDFEDAFDLGEQSFEESEVPAGDSGDRSDRLCVGEVAGSSVLPRERQWRCRTNSSSSLPRGR